MLRNSIWIAAAIVTGATVIILNGVQLPQVSVDKLSDGVIGSIIGGCIGIVGSLYGARFGSKSAYRYNVKLEKERTKERRAIQTKNLIISPIYKQLMGLKVYIEEHKNPISPKIRVNFSTERYIIPDSYTFDVWENIKGDIRKLYVPGSRRNELDALTEQLKAHMAFQQHANESIIKIAEEFSITYSDRRIARPHYNPRLLGNTLSMYASDKTHPALSSSIREHLQTDYNFDDTEREEKAIQLMRQVDEHEAQVSLVDSFNDVAASVEKLSSAFEKMVSDVIDKYEGGVE